jgi:hypothetical protein
LALNNNLTIKFDDVFKTVKSVFETGAQSMFEVNLNEKKLHHDIAEILLKLALNTNQSINQSINQGEI